MSVPQIPQAFTLIKTSDSPITDWKLLQVGILPQKTSIPASKFPPIRNLISVMGCIQYFYILDQLWFTCVGEMAASMVETRIEHRKVKVPGLGKPVREVGV